MRLKNNLLIFVIVIFLIFTYSRNPIWQTEVSLWSDVVDKSPEKARPHFNLGLALLNDNRPLEAEKEFRVTLRIAPYYHKAKYYLAESLFRTGRYREALQYLKEVEFLYEKVLPEFPEKWEGVSKAFRGPDLYNNIGSCYYYLGDLLSAERYYRKALAIDRYHLFSIKGLVTVLTDKGKIKEAISLIRETIKDMPDERGKKELYRILKDLEG
jgi:tetratricopeptide (TPR) repeat protein